MWKTVCLSKGWFRYSESHRLHSAAPLWLSSDYRVDVMRDTGELYVWGRNKHGQLASLAAFLLLPQRIDASCFQDEKVIAVWSGWTHLVAQTVDLPLIDSLIRVLQNMEHCQKKLANSTEAPTNCVSTQDDFHMKILKDISCEFLSNIFQALTKETMAKGLKEGQLSKKKYSCAFQSLLPLYSPVVEDFIKVLHEVDKAVAEDLEESFPSVKAQLKTQV
ncbi:protein SAAL1 isoform X2 [Cricetulus griseus]|uniref:protein SAAL1 isoform X2 n=1 Tax=Cricetulus griseus TaxID=10029 RepID=UPI0004543053|nr:protein SAAL1 isoform X2 [Cricetulus griseus]